MWQSSFDLIIFAPWKATNVTKVDIVMLITRFQTKGSCQEYFRTTPENVLLITPSKHYKAVWFEMIPFDFLFEIDERTKLGSDFKVQQPNRTRLWLTIEIYYKYWWY